MRPGFGGRGIGSGPLRAGTRADTPDPPLKRLICTCCSGNAGHRRVTVTPASKEHPVTSTTRLTPEKVGRMATKVAAETAYVVTGLADVLAGTVQDVVKQGKTTYTDRKAAGGSPVKDYA